MITMRFDGTPFMLERVTNGKRTMLFCPGIEADRQRAINTTDLERSALGKHIRQLKEFFEKEIYKTHYGFPNSMVPIITTNEHHMQVAMDCTRQVYGGPCRHL